VAEQIENLFPHVFQLQSKIHQHLGCHPLLLSEEAEQHVFRADVVVVEVAGLFHRVFDHLLGPRRVRQLPHRHHIGTALHQLLYLEADLAEIDVQVLEHIGGDAAPLLDEAEQQVFGADVLVIEPLGLLVGQLHDFAGTVREALVHDVGP